MSSAPPVKRALLIGVDEYANFPRRDQLEGCANDARLMRKVLEENFGFPPEHMTLLCNTEATQQAIRDAMEQLIATTGPDDIVVLHYSGHGSQMTDREGDEPDGMDETIMPHDAGRWDRENRDISDDEFYVWLTRLAEKTPYTTLIFDCCHSGTMTRDAFGGKSREMEPDRRPVEELPPSPVGKAFATRGGGSRGPSGWLPLDGRYVLMAGCRDEQRSYEHRVTDEGDPVIHGALTFYLCQELVGARPGATYQEVFDRARTNVNAANNKQNPQIEGALHREIFGIKDNQPMRSIRVGARTDNVVTLEAGVAHGLTVDSEWAVFPPGTMTDEGDPKGNVKIVSVDAVSSGAQIIDEATAGQIAVNDRAFERSHAYAAARIGVCIEAPTDYADHVAQMKREVDGQDLTELVDDRARAELCVYLIPPRESVTDEDPVPQLGPVAEPTWAAVRDGELVMPPKRIDDYGVVAKNMVTLARYRQMLRIGNPDPHSPLAGKVTLDLLRRRPDGTWVTAEPEGDSGQVVYEEGDPIALQLTNRHDQPVYVYLFDFGLTGRVSQVYPQGGANEQLIPNETKPFRLPRPGDDWSVSIPAELQQPEGIETFKLFVTSSEANFAFLEQAGTRSARRHGTSPLDEIVQRAFSGAATRDIKQVKSGQDWTTVDRPFVVRKKTPSERLHPDGKPVAVGRVTLSTPGLAGRVKTHSWESARAQDAALATGGRLRDALRATSIDVHQTIEIDEAREVDMPTTRSTSDGEPAIEVEIDDPGDDRGQFMLSQDPSGVISWHFAEPAERTRSTGSARRRTFVIPRQVGRAETGPATRGVLGAVGKKFLEVFVFPLLDPVLGAVGDYFASQWEAKRRPYRLRSFTPENFGAPDVPDLTGDEWRRLGAGRALMLVHGTFSRAHTAFSRLPADYVARLHEIYGGRVFAFDHFTLSQDPRQNIEWLLEHGIPEDASLDMDIVCHSRGGLVSRVLTEKLGELAPGLERIRIRKVVFVAAPNAGTSLADAAHVGKFIDGYTNLLNFFDLLPDNGVTEVLEGILTVAKQVSVGAYGGLEGIQSMRPGGDFMTWLNRGGPRNGAQYFAISSDFEPSDTGFKNLVANHFADKIFKQHNDLVVPTQGVFEENGSSAFPISTRHVFEREAGVGHSAYFDNPAARAKLLEWLGS